MTVDVIALAERAQEVAVPMKLVPDWDVMFKILEEHGAVIIRCDPATLRVTMSGGIEAPLVKQFNNHVRVVKKMPFRYKRLSSHLWLCYLPEACNGK